MILSKSSVRLRECFADEWWGLKRDPPYKQFNGSLIVSYRNNTVHCRYGMKLKAKHKFCTSKMLSRYTDWQRLNEMFDNFFVMLPFLQENACCHEARWWWFLLGQRWRRSWPSPQGIASEAVFRYRYRKPYSDTRTGAGTSVAEPKIAAPTSQSRKSGLRPVRYLENYLFGLEYRYFCSRSDACFTFIWLKLYQFTKKNFRKHDFFL